MTRIARCSSTRAAAHLQVRGCFRQTLGLGCLTPLSAIFQLYRGGQLLVEDTVIPEETTALPQVTDKLYHIGYRVHLVCAGFELTTLVVICTDCIGSCKSNYHTITTTTAPWTHFKLQVMLVI